jgi:hypothetical protein
MARKKHSPEQIVAILRQIEVEVANHKPTGQACRKRALPNKPTIAGARNTAV